MTCIGNSGELPKNLSKSIEENDIVVSSVLSGNRNFEGRVHPLTKANYLASPPLCVAYALAGNVNIDINNDPIGTDSSGKKVFLRDLWPSNEEILDFVKKNISKEMFLESYKDLDTSNKRWNDLEIENTDTFNWSDKSTYIHNPPFF